MRIFAGVVALIVFAAFADAANELPPPIDVSLDVDASQVLRTIDPRMLAGTNVAAWEQKRYFASPELLQAMRELRTGVIRMPGGSWGDILYWNGHGVRDAKGNVDPARMKDGWPAVDYSAYAPSFAVDDKRRPLAREAGGWTGDVHVKILHEFIRDVGAEQLVIVNAGSGRALDAAEWVRFANLKMGYKVKYWEIGNELDGGWENGHVMPDGTVLTAGMYAKRFREFARAMKAVDPTIKIGGAASGTDDGGFAEVLLRDAGDEVDFVSVHIYPGNPAYDTAKQFERVKTAAEAAQRVRKWVKQYQPDRADKIELAITEWGLPEYSGRNMLINALWSNLFVQESAAAGFNFMNQWHSIDLIRPENPEKPGENLVPLAQYWGLWMWTHYTGDRIVKSTRNGDGRQVHALATRTDGELDLTLVNTDPDREANVTLMVDGFEPAAHAERAELTHRECFWDPVAQRLVRSRPPLVTAIAIGKTTTFMLPPFSIVALRIPAAGATPTTSPAIGAGAAQQLRLIVPAEAYAGDRIEGWIDAAGPSTQPASLTVKGAGRADRSMVRIAESAGHFFVELTDVGSVTLTARVGDSTASAAILSKPTVARPIVLWEFEDLTADRHEGCASDWTLSPDTSVRANQRVARIDLKDALPTEERRRVLRIDLPRSAAFQPANVRGVFFDLLTAPDFACDDPDASLSVIMQSPADWWMELGRVPLTNASKWQTQAIAVTEAKHISAMPFAYNVIFVLNAKKPVSGSIFLDRAGLMVR